MKIDLHIHSRTGSDGNFSLEDIFTEAKKRNIKCLSITDHDSIEYQDKAQALGRDSDIIYFTGVELNVTFAYGGKPVSLDFLGYLYEITEQDLKNKLKLIREHRENRALQILEKINHEFKKEGITPFNEKDLENIQATVDGTFGRPHIANYMINKGIVSDKQEAFNKYLIKCDVPKYPLALQEASRLIRNARGKIVLAHPDDPNGTSLRSITTDLDEQGKIINENMKDYIDGVECWHSRHSVEATWYYVGFAQKNNLLVTGGSDCHQKPVLMGTLDIPDFVYLQFKKLI